MEKIWFCDKNGKKIKNEFKKGEAVRIINDAIEQEKEFLEKEGLVGSIEDFQSDLYIKIIDHGSRLEVDLAPKSRAGHDFNFIVKKRGSKLKKDSLTIGEVISEPRE